MKKIFALVLILSMIFSLCGCFTATKLDEEALGGIEQEDPKESVQEDKDEEYREGDIAEPDGSGDVTDSSEESEDGGENTDPVMPEPPLDEPVPPEDTDIVIEGPVFANDWASNDIEKMLPNPPFGPWEETDTPEDLHIVSTPFDAIDYGAESQDRIALANYFAWLQNMGFTVNEIGYSSADVLGAELPDHWLVIDQQGRVAQISIYPYMDGKEYFMGYAVITFELGTFGIDSTGDDQSIFDEPAGETVTDMNEVLSFMPALPFSGFEGGHVGGNIYEYSVIGLNTSGATNPPDSGEPDGKDKDIFLGWLATLPSYGFDVMETGEGYEWTAADVYGNFVTFMIGDGGLFLTVERVSGSPAVEEPVEPVEPSVGSSVNLPELPYGECEKLLEANEFSLKKALKAIEER